jgi:leucyl aminopeptidase
MPKAGSYWPTPITYAQEKGATRIIDLATLTGACVTALGTIRTGHDGE